MHLNHDDIYITSVMVQAAESMRQQLACPFPAYLCYWMAWANMYKSLAKQAGLHPHFGLRKNGTLRIKRDGDLKMAEVYAPTEDAQLNKAFGLFDDTLKHQLIAHPNTRYFVYRTPSWRGKVLKQDTFGQRLNGVLSINQTLDPRYPVWSPIDAGLYQSYMGEKLSDGDKEKAQNLLAKQILNVLHTIQENLLHGDAQATESSHQLVEQALPILSGLVTSFFNAP